MKKFLLAILSFLLIFSISQVYAYTLIGDYDNDPYYMYSPDGDEDGLIKGYWDGDDSNPGILKNDSEAAETAWLQSLLGDTDVVEFYSKDEGPDGGGPEAFEGNWTYAVLKYGLAGADDPSEGFGHVAIKSELGIDGLEIDDFPTYQSDLIEELTGEIFPTLTSDTRVSHITYFNHVPEPATLLLLGTGLIGLAGFGRKKFLAK